MASHKNPQGALRNKIVLLGLTGSIAIYKSCELVRRLRDEGSTVYCLMSPGAKEFITPLTFGALSGSSIGLPLPDRKPLRLHPLNQF